MKYRYTIIVFIFMSYVAVAQQRKTDFGIILGGSYYNGDLNPSKQFHNVKLSLGALARLNVNRRFALRVSGYYMGLKATQADSREVNFPVTTSFITNLLDLTGQFEFNFLPYQTGDEKLVGSTYLAAGIGYTMGLSNGSHFLNIPFGIGFKLNLTERLSTGVEWSFRKTFYDQIDNFTSPTGKSLLNNNDWYSTFGLLITYKFVKFAADCAAYK